MDFKNVDRDYVICCKKYLKNWMEENGVPEFRITEEALDAIILYGGEGLYAVQKSFFQILQRAQGDGLTKIEISYVEECIGKSVSESYVSVDTYRGME